MVEFAALSPYWLILVGLGAGLIVLPWLMSRYSFNQAPSVPATTCAGLTLRPPAADGVRCLVGGRAAPGPGGPFPAPVSGRPCVWALFRVAERQRGGRSYINEMDFLRREEASTAPFALEDGGGRIQVDPAGIELDFLVSPPNGAVFHAERYFKAADLLPHADRYARAPDATKRVFGPLGQLTEEWIVPPGQQMWLEGVARQGPNGEVVLSRPPGGRLRLSVRSPEARTAVRGTMLGIRRRLMWIGIALLALAGALTVGAIVWALLDP